MCLHEKIPPWLAPRARAPYEPALFQPTLSFNVLNVSCCMTVRDDNATLSICSLTPPTRLHRPPPHPRLARVVRRKRLVQRRMRCQRSVVHPVWSRTHTRTNARPVYGTRTHVQGSVVYQTRTLRSNLPPPRTHLPTSKSSSLGLDTPPLTTTHTHPPLASQQESRLIGA